MDSSELVSTVWLFARARKKGFSCPDATCWSCIPTHLCICTSSAIYLHTFFVMPGNMVYDRLLKQQVPTVICKAASCSLQLIHKTYRIITFISLSVLCGYTGVHKNEG